MPASRVVAPTDSDDAVAHVAKVLRADRHPPRKRLRLGRAVDELTGDGLARPEER